MGTPTRIKVDVCSDRREWSYDWKQIPILGYSGNAIRLERYHRAFRRGDVQDGYFLHELYSKHPSVFEGDEKRKELQIEVRHVGPPSSVSTPGRSDGGAYSWIIAALTIPAPELDEALRTVGFPEEEIENIKTDGGANVEGVLDGVRKREIRKSDFRADEYEDAEHAHANLERFCVCLLDNDEGLHQAAKASFQPRIDKEPIRLYIHKYATGC